MSLAIAGAGIGAALNIFKAREENKALRRRQESIAKAAGVSQGRVNRFVTQTRVRALNETAALSRNLQATVGAARLTRPEGVSSRGAIATTVGAGATDTESIQIQQEFQELSAADERQDIANRARSQVDELQSGKQNLIMAGIQGGIQGYQIGTQLDSAITGLQSLKNTARFESQFSDLNLDLVRLRKATQVAQTNTARAFARTAQAGLNFENSRLSLLMQGSILRRNPPNSEWRPRFFYGGPRP